MTCPSCELFDAFIDMDVIEEEVYSCCRCGLKVTKQDDHRDTRPTPSEEQ